MRNTLFALAGLATMAATLAATPALAADKLVIGNEGTYPPFSMVQPSGELIGIEPEMAREMCKRMGVTCEFAVMHFKALIPSLLQGKVDVVGSQIKPLAERKEKALFGMPIVFNHDTYVVPKAKSYTFTKEGLKGAKIGVQRGSSQAKYITDTFGDAVKPVLYDNPDQIRLDLLNGRVDMAFGAKLNWTVELIDKPEGKDWKLAGGDVWTGDTSMPEAERGSSWIARKGETALVAKMDAALKAMIADCSVTKIRKKYLSVPIVPGEEACEAKSG